VNYEILLEKINQAEDIENGERKLSLSIIKILFQDKKTQKFFVQKNVFLKKFYLKKLSQRS